MSEEHHSFDPFTITGERTADEASLIETLGLMIEPSNGNVAIKYSTLSNVAALLGWYLKDVNWVGFYVVDGEKLILGPFSGLPACTQIQYGCGVCGGSWAQKKTLRVPDVHKFPGHIACDSASNSEIVTPIMVGDKVVGVLDIDSPKFERFSEEDEQLCNKIVEMVSAAFN